MWLSTRASPSRIDARMLNLDLEERDDEDDDNDDVDGVDE